MTGFAPGDLVYHRGRNAVFEVAEGLTDGDYVLVYVEQARIVGGLLIKSEAIPGRARTEFPADELEIWTEDMAAEPEPESVGKKVLDRLRGVFGWRPRRRQRRQRWPLNGDLGSDNVTGEQSSAARQHSGGRARTGRGVRTRCSTSPQSRNTTST